MALDTQGMTAPPTATTDPHPALAPLSDRKPTPKTVAPTPAVAAPKPEAPVGAEVTPDIQRMLQDYESKLAAANAEMPEKPQAPVDNPLKAFASVGMLIAAFGSKFAGTGITGALNAGAAAMEALHEGDLKTYANKIKEWQVHKDYVTEIQKDFTTRFKAIYDNDKLNWNERMSMMKLMQSAEFANANLALHQQGMELRVLKMGESFDRFTEKMRQQTQRTAYSQVAEMAKSVRNPDGSPVATDRLNAANAAIAQLFLDNPDADLSAVVTRASSILRGEGTTYAPPGTKPPTAADRQAGLFRSVQDAFKNDPNAKEVTVGDQVISRKDWEAAQKLDAASMASGMAPSGVSPMALEIAKGRIAAAERPSAAPAAVPPASKKKADSPEGEARYMQLMREGKTVEQTYAQMEKEGYEH